MFEYVTDSKELLDKLDLAFKREERIMRWITVKLDKNAVAYAESRRKRLNTKKQEA